MVFLPLRTFDYYFVFGDAYVQATYFACLLVCEGNLRGEMNRRRMSLSIIHRGSFS